MNSATLNNALLLGVRQKNYDKSLINTEAAPPYKIAWRVCKHRAVWLRQLYFLVTQCQLGHLPSVWLTSQTALTDPRLYWLTAVSVSDGYPTPNLRGAHYFANYWVRLLAIGNDTSCNTEIHGSILLDPIQPTQSTNSLTQSNPIHNVSPCSHTIQSIENNFPYMQKSVQHLEVTPWS